MTPAIAGVTLVESLGDRWPSVLYWAGLRLGANWLAAAGSNKKKRRNKRSQEEAIANVRIEGTSTSDHCSDPFGNEKAGRKSLKNYLAAPKSLVLLLPEHAKIRLLENLRRFKNNLEQCRMFYRQRSIEERESNTTPQT